MNSSGPETESHSASQADRAYVHLRSMVRAGQLRSGDLVSENQLAKSQGFGRTPLREAVSRLVHEGLFVRHPRRGVTIRTLDADDLRDLYEVREWVEVCAIRKAVAFITHRELAELREKIQIAENAVEAGCTWMEYREFDREFHSIVWKASGNDRVVDLLTSLHDSALLDPFESSAPVMPNKAHSSIREHRAIVEALEERDAETAEAAIVRHARVHRNELVRRIFGIEGEVTDFG